MKKTLYKILYAFSYLFPRNARKFVVIGWHKRPDGEVFADNAKYFYLYLSKQQVRAIWLSKSKALAIELRSFGLESYYEKSFRGIWHLLTAKFICIDAFLQPQHYVCSGRAKILQLLHGKGMKKKGYSEPQLRKNDMVFHTSPFAIELMPESFKRGAINITTGYSRNDVLFKTIEHSMIGVDKDMLLHLQDLQRHGTPTILYAPTFRRGEKTISI